MGLLQESLAAHLAAGRPLRVLTTGYLGATDRKALDWLVARGARMRVSTDTRRTRLHAKATPVPFRTGGHPRAGALRQSRLRCSAAQDRQDGNPGGIAAAGSG
jgi:hypothetical protein